jgi:hypothetical protein
MPEDRPTMIERMRAEVEETVRAIHDAMHRALDRKYNLLRVSSRRWRVVRVSSVAQQLHQHADVVTFEAVTPPLAWEDALQALAEYRQK